MTTLDERPAQTATPRINERNWRDFAVCRREDPEEFFAPPTAIVQTMEAKAVCQRCPVRLACLAESFDLSAADGVWGGASEAERLRARRRILRAGLPTTTDNLVEETELILLEASS